VRVGLRGGLVTRRKGEDKLTFESGRPEEKVSAGQDSPAGRRAPSGRGSSAARGRGSGDGRTGFPGEEESSGGRTLPAPRISASEG